MTMRTMLGRLALVLCMAIGAAEAQAPTAVLRARVVDSTGVPRAGALVIASDPAAGTELARAVTDAEGAFTMRLGAARVRLRVLSIGHAPGDAGLVEVVAGAAPLTLRVGLRPVQLPAVVTSERSQCGAPAGGSAAAVLLAEARTAILLSQSVPSGTPPQASVARFAYWTGTDGQRQGRPTVTRSGGATLRPFQSVPRAVLDAEGFVVEESDGTVYRAPDASWFTDDAFAREHCFSLRANDDSTSALVGIAFEPRTRARHVQVAGVLWVDSSSFALSHVDYRYVGLDRARAAGAGGRIRFAQLPSGLWFEERWELRMPQLRTTLGTPDVARGGRATSTVVDRVRVIGGQVLRLQLGDEVVFASADAGLDSLEAEARAGTMAPVGVGAPGVIVDSLVSEACALEPGEAAEGEPTATLSGTVIGAPDDVGVRVSVEWRERFREEGGHNWRWTNRRLDTHTQPGGRFTFCAVPRNRALTLRAEHESRRAGPLLLRVAEGDASARADLRLTATSVARGQLRLRVIGEGGQPIPFATVAVDGGTPLPANAEGTITMRARSRSAVRVSARRIGFVPVDTSVVVDAGEEVAVVLRPVAQRLDAVVVRADPTPLERAGFYDRAERVQRGAFTADFLTPEMLDLRNSAQVSQHLQLSRFVTLEWSKEPRPRRVIRGRAGCKMEVMLDGQRAQLRTEDDRAEVPIDDLVSGMEVSAIEVYPSLANAPAELIPLTGRGECGLIAIWTGGRR